MPEDTFSHGLAQLWSLPYYVIKTMRKHTFTLMSNIYHNYCSCYHSNECAFSYEPGTALSARLYVRPVNPWLSTVCSAMYLISFKNTWIINWR